MHSFLGFPGLSNLLFFPCSSLCLTCYVLQTPFFRLSCRGAFCRHPCFRPNFRGAGARASLGPALTPRGAPGFWGAMPAPLPGFSCFPASSGEDFKKAQGHSHP